MVFAKFASGWALVATDLPSYFSLFACSLLAGI